MAEIGPIRLDPSPSRELFDAYTMPGASEQTFSIAGFAIEEPGTILTRVLPIQPMTRMRIARKLRRPTRRHKRLCERDGHPASRLAPEYDTTVTPTHAEPGTWSVEMQVQDEHRWCQRCGASLPAAP